MFVDTSSSPLFLEQLIGGHLHAFALIVLDVGTAHTWPLCLWSSGTVKLQDTKTKNQTGHCWFESSRIQPMPLHFSNCYVFQDGITKCSRCTGKVLRTQIQIFYGNREASGMAFRAVRGRQAAAGSQCFVADHACSS